jgi:hypothetical protein
MALPYQKRMPKKPEKTSEPKFVINPSAPSTGTEGWGYGKNEASSVNFGVSTEEIATATKDAKVSEHVVRRVPASPADANPRLNKAESEHKPSSAQSVNQSSADLEEHIRRRAYELYLERGQKEGHDIEDWERARAEIRGSDQKIA